MTRMIEASVFTIGLLTLSVAAQAQAPARPAPKLQFADVGAVAAWKPGGPRLLFIEDKKNQWYRVDLLEPCMDLFPGKEPTFVTETDLEGQRFSGVELEHHQCTVTNLVKITEPPPEQAYVAPPRPAPKPAAVPTTKK